MGEKALIAESLAPLNVYLLETLTLQTTELRWKGRVYMEAGDKLAQNFDLLLLRA